ncbi:hypothetical protein K505DRAFT_107689 [Melanomma pulvis-pyrius CBS 109.77]|uniref:Uncharacterized protein n=1 Tax=Melanomma pulvis-pyrius CBS 109.77 TaxID=1314802 RepID=A0A6A6WWN4_9PLEO|nr:hypothetical protein K505DRAFT_107689 [Melanomma pulvis-pyrius CBS 109.77]
MCSCSSSSVKLPSAASVVAHSIVVELMSSCGGGRGPFRFLSDLDAEESIDAEDAFSFFTRPSAPLRPSADGRGDFSPGMCMDGRMSFFCLDAGKISSRSTGTPRDTRNRRRIRDRTQSGGWRGGGATSCDHSDRLRSERNMDRTPSWFVVDILGMSLVDGYISSM